MVQLTAYGTRGGGSSLNSYDAVSNGNFDDDEPLLDTDISRISLVPEVYYWARSSKHFDGKLTVVQVSTVFGEEPNYWTLALPGTDQHDRNIAMLRNAGVRIAIDDFGSMTSMARAKGLKTTAEGVETDEQSDALVALG
ncbi:hypothetical protein [Rhizobium changzhiense]|uniref:hypothetical protein n=2 Tax=Rhizobium TaxID=379 RepID=UPI001FD192C1|nr:hypothetical protein [Rhizobium changzhiense]